MRASGTPREENVETLSVYYFKAFAAGHRYNVTVSNPRRNVQIDLSGVIEIEQD
jgi:hypothetical protein